MVASRSGNSSQSAHPIRSRNCRSETTCMSWSRSLAALPKRCTTIKPNSCALSRPVVPRYDERHAGRHDFDFIFGTWRVHNHKLRDAADRDCTDWVDFDTRSHAEPILGGLAHTDRIVCGPGSPHGDWEGFTLRQFDPARRLWRIWWASTKAPGRLDPPLAGR